MWHHGEFQFESIVMPELFVRLFRSARETDGCHQIFSLFLIWTYNPADAPNVRDLAFVVEISTVNILTKHISASLVPRRRPNDGPDSLHTHERNLPTAL